MSKQKSIRIELSEDVAQQLQAEGDKEKRKLKNHCEYLLIRHVCKKKGGKDE